MDTNTSTDLLVLLFFDSGKFDRFPRFQIARFGSMVDMLYGVVIVVRVKSGLLSRGGSKLDVLVKSTVENTNNTTRLLMSSSLKTHTHIHIDTQLSSLPHPPHTSTCTQ